MNASSGRDIVEDMPITLSRCILCVCKGTQYLTLFFINLHFYEENIWVAKLYRHRDFINYYFVNFLLLTKLSQCNQNEIQSLIKLQLLNVALLWYACRQWSGGHTRGAAGQWQEVTPDTGYVHTPDCRPRELNNSRNSWKHLIKAIVTNHLRAQ